MAVTIRLSRTGKKKDTSYRLVVADQRFQRDGRVLERIGTYKPSVKPAVVNVKRDRVDYWIGKGAKPTPTVARLLRKPKPATEAPKS